ncbi:hypothetical protein K504DRAFT_108477 [Pleomassaria siparia CBS 279.74]|uniref:Methyltransferase type 11 domain-containing protein n=1 Tax=Pleomassaria siparia CBS 279.74 TaxID=1314801 RepID=A0A6G1JXT2_9PLEO|nr:hypothetical protein K504DRAFT_108477 [Pleomassaria siparia CBS 279.74]
MPEVFPSAAFPYPAVLGALPDAQYCTSPLDRRQSLNTIAEDDSSTIPRYYFTPRYSPTSTYQPSAISPQSCDDFPTPKAADFNMTRPSPQPSPRHPYPSPSYLSQHRLSRTESEFDSLYDITDDEFEVPLAASASVKRTTRNRYPSIVIPSPTCWPTIEKLRSAMSAVQPTSAQLPTPSRQGLSALATHNLRVPGHSAEPSLDGSLTSEDMDKLSCPATPDTQQRKTSSVDEWGPVQLDLQAMETLQHLDSSPDSSPEQQASQVIEAGEMQEISRPFLGLCIPSTLIQNGSSESTPVSALSVPSPGGFFSSLQPTSRYTWSIPKVEESAPNTSTAENFYGVPFESRRDTLGGSTLDGLSDNLPTSRPVLLNDPEEALEVKEINPSKTIFQYSDKYNSELERQSSINLERTGHWLEEQVELQAALREMSTMGSPSTSSPTHSRGNSLDKTLKKSVTFAENTTEVTIKAGEAKKTDIFVQGFEYLQEHSEDKDSFIHRQTRAEAMHVNRRCMPKVHRDQLLGKFEITEPVRPSPSRPVSEFYVNDPTALKESIARAQVERQALDQMLPSTWVMQALKQLNGGKLLSKPASKRITSTRNAKILDVGGVPTNDWAWHVAYDYPFSTTTTVYTGRNQTSDVSGPENHKHMTVPNLWTLPFPSGHFDVVSARSLYEFLKTDKPLGRSMDEYDLCLKECHRVLKTGGVLDFSLIDADIIHAGRQAQAMGVEFGFNLKTRGYDASPTKSFLPRLNKAGFQDVQRMWMVLPMGKTSANWRDVLLSSANKQEERSISPGGQVQIQDAPVFGTTGDAALLTGMVGSWAYEKWLLRLQGAKNNSGWRYLTGYARK